MDFKGIILAFAFVIIAVNCQYDIHTLNLINATQHLQDLERYGVGVIQNIYPQLNHSEIDNKPAENNNITNNNNNNSSGGTSNIPNFVRPVNVTRPSLEKFINKTMSTIPSGICVKEVP